MRSATRVAREVLTTVHVVGVLIVVEALIRWVPLPRLSRLLGVRLDLAPTHGDLSPLPIGELPAGTRRKLRCTHRVTEVWPLSKGPCLRRSLVAARLLRDHEAAVRLGVASAGGDVLAHAWIEIGGRPLEDVTGFSAFSERTGPAIP